MANKRRRGRRKRRRERAGKERGDSSPKPRPSAPLLEEQGAHFQVPETLITEQSLEKMEKRYRQAVRDSELWTLMVAEYGNAEAERLLKQFRVKLQ